MKRHVKQSIYFLTNLIGLILLFVVFPVILNPFVLVMGFLLTMWSFVKGVSS